MIRVFSRAYADESTANAVAYKMRLAGFPQYQMQVVAKREGKGKKYTAEKLSSLDVQSGTAEAYAEKISKGSAVLVVRADYRPLTAKTIAREMLDASDAMDIGAHPEVNDVKAGPEPSAPSILQSHPRFLTMPADPDDPAPRRISEVFGFRLLSKRKPRSNSVYSGDKRFGAFLVPLLSKKDRKISVFQTEKRYGAFLVPLLSHKKRRSSVIKGGGQPFSHATGWSPLSSRD